MPGKENPMPGKEARRDSGAANEDKGPIASPSSVKDVAGQLPGDVFISIRLNLALQETLRLSSS
jgi:hypothetical protein